MPFKGPLQSPNHFMMLWHLRLVHLGSFSNFGSDEILLFLCKHLFCFQVLWARFIGQGGISQPLIKDWAWTCPNLDSGRKRNSLMWSDRSTCAQGMKRKKSTYNTCCLVDYAEIVWSPGHTELRDGQPFLKNIRPLEDPLQQAVGKKCTQCVKLPVFWGF